MSGRADYGLFWLGFVIGAFLTLLFSALIFGVPTP